MFFNPEKHRIKKHEFRQWLEPEQEFQRWFEPEQEFQRAGTGVPASRNRSSSEIVGISPYDGQVG
jgi:hypothetical protein